MKAGWRWFGPSDAISLAEIRQAGVTDVVTSLYSHRPGDLWTLREIKACADTVRKAGMTWSVVESVPVHEDVKKRTGNFRRYVENYKRNLRNLAKCGVKTVCYNFMPVHDWARTDLHKVLPDGSVTLAYDQNEVCAFEMFVLKRQGLESDYDAAIRARAKRLWAKASSRDRKRIASALLLGLPGTTNDATPAGLRRELAAYTDIDGATLKRNLYEFLNQITLVLEDEGIDMAIHPDDPPFPIFGLPRILSSSADIREMVKACPSKRVGVTLCTGSLGANLANDCVKIFREFHDRIHFCHFRNLIHSAPGMFRESDSHLVGNTDMPALMLELVKEEKRRGHEIVVRPDHGRMLDIDKGRKCYYGYSYGGRLIGLSELRGLEAGIKFFNDMSRETQTASRGPRFSHTTCEGKGNRHGNTIKSTCGKLAAIAAICVAAALSSWAIDNPVAADYTLTEDETVDAALTVNSGVTVDLAGHKLTVKGLGTAACFRVVVRRHLGLSKPCRTGRACRTICMFLHDLHG